MATVVSASDSLLKQGSLGSKVLIDTGEMAGRSCRLLSTKTSEKDGAEVQSFSTRVLSVITQIWHNIQALFSQEIPESSREIFEYSQEPLKKELECHIATMKDPNLNLSPLEKLDVFLSLLEFSCEWLEYGPEEMDVCVGTQIQDACNELPPLLKQELYLHLGVPDTGQLKVDSYQDLLRIREEFRVIHEDLPSVELARLHRVFLAQTTHKGRSNTMLSMMQVSRKISKLDPDVTLASIKAFVTGLDDTYDEFNKQTKVNSDWGANS